MLEIKKKICSQSALMTMGFDEEENDGLIATMAFDEEDNGLAATMAFG